MDSELDLISSFRSMNTNDKEFLISEFKRLSNNSNLSNDECCFYLDLAEWNLNCALWNYYDNDGGRQSLSSLSLLSANTLPKMRLVNDVTIGEGESIAPLTTFTKTWKIQNIGSEQWPFGCHLKLVNGYDLSEDNSINTSSAQFTQNDRQFNIDNIIITYLPQLQPNEMGDINIKLRSPLNPAIYQSQYRLFTQHNTPFGGNF
jgi:hypothetical protein